MPPRVGRVLATAEHRVPPILAQQLDDVVAALFDERRHESYVRGAGEGWSVTCDDAAKNVFAWEYDDERGSCGCKVDYYGCLNSRPCCNALSALIATN